MKTTSLFANLRKKVTNPLLIPILCLTATANGAYGQGSFVFANNRTSATRLGSIEGPLAGPGIWAHVLAGETTGSLVPVGRPAEHPGYGRVFGGVVEVPGSSAYTWVFVQMLAWDGRLWGTNLAGVPADQFGRTDAVRILLVLYDNAYDPPFTQPAIVPIPEPSVGALGALGGGLLLGLRSRRGRRAAAPAEMTAPSQSACITAAPSGVGVLQGA